MNTSFDVSLCNSFFDNTKNNKILALDFKNRNKQKTSWISPPPTQKPNLIDFFLIDMIHYQCYFLIESIYLFMYEERKKTVYQQYFLPEVLDMVDW